MSVLVNGRMQNLPEPPTLAALLVALAPPIPFAVACNGEFIPSRKLCRMRNPAGRPYRHRASCSGRLA